MHIFLAFAALSIVASLFRLDHSYTICRHLGKVVMPMLLLDNIYIFVHMRMVTLMLTKELVLMRGKVSRSIHLNILYVGVIHEALQSFLGDAYCHGIIICEVQVNRGSRRCPRRGLAFSIPVVDDHACRVVPGGQLREEEAVSGALSDSRWMNRAAALGRAKRRAAKVSFIFNLQ
jgi:hypothetical protein